MELVIREESSQREGYKVAIIINGERFEGLVTDPFAKADKEAAEALLEWYFEEWLKYPMLQTTRAEKACASIRTYGEELFKQLFFPSSPNRALSLAYEKFIDGAAANAEAVVKVSGSSDFHALHWELMWDP